MTTRHRNRGALLLMTPDQLLARLRERPLYIRPGQGRLLRAMLLKADVLNSQGYRVEHTALGTGGGIWLELEPTRRETTTRAVGDFLAGQKVKHQPPPT